MRISIVGVGKLAGLAAGIALLTLLVLWSRARYTIEGSVRVEEGSAAGPARQVEVRLVSQNYEDSVAQLVQQYQRAYEAVLQAAVTQLIAKVNDIAASTNAAGGAGGLSLEALPPADTRSARERLRDEHPEVQRLVRALEKELGPLTDDERKDVSARVQRYLEFSLYCREMMQVAPVGARFYERAAEYWEERAEALKKTGRAITDDAALSYETEWFTGGLGDEPVQRVSRISRTNEALLAALREARSGEQAPAPTPAAPPQKPRRSGGVLPHSSLTSNDVQTALAAALRELQHTHDTVVRAAEDALLDETLDIAATGDDGRFAFRGDTVQPGSYIIFAKYDILSLEGEQMQLVWFEPVAVSLRRFAFNKSTRLDLTELNQRRPAVMDLRVPAQEALFATLVEEVRNARKQ